MSILEKFRLDGKTALVTGGTRGIGLGIARALGQAGAKVMISGRAAREGVLDDLAGSGVDALFEPADLADPTAPGKLVATAAERLGGLDILVNNAGVAIHGGSIEFSDENWGTLMTTNLDAVFRACRAALGPMRDAGGGVILNIGSISGLISNVPQNQAAYNASKAAVHMLTKSLASEFAADSIRVNAIAPGYIETDMTAGGFANPEWAPVWTGMTPMGRAAHVDEVAGGALYLCAPASSYVTGAVLVIDGGYTLR